MKNEKKPVNVRLQLPSDVHQKLVDKQKDIKDRFDVKVPIATLIIYNLDNIEEIKFSMET